VGVLASVPVGVRLKRYTPLVRRPAARGVSALRTPLSRRTTAT
jgi:hypothetical protein